MRFTIYAYRDEPDHCVFDQEAAGAFILQFCDPVGVFEADGVLAKNMEPLAQDYWLLIGDRQFRAQQVMCGDAGPLVAELWRAD